MVGVVVRSDAGDSRLSSLLEFLFGMRGTNLTLLREEKLM